YITAYEPSIAQNVRLQNLLATYQTAQPRNYQTRSTPAPSGLHKPSVRLSRLNRMTDTQDARPCSLSSQNNRADHSMLRRYMDQCSVPLSVAMVDCHQQAVAALRASH